MALVEVSTPSQDGSPPAVTAAAAETSGTSPRWQVVVGSFVAIASAWFASAAINSGLHPSALAIPAGVSLFGMLYAVTQGLERLLEPVSAFFLSTKQQSANRNATLAAAKNMQAVSDEQLPAKLSELAKAATAAQELQAAEPPPKQPAIIAWWRRRRWWRTWRRNLATEGVTAARERFARAMLPTLEAYGHDPQLVKKQLARSLDVPEGEASAVVKKAAVDLAAAAQAELEQRRADKGIAFWALATVLGLLLSAALGLYLLHIVGLQDDGLARDGTWTSGAMSAAGIRHMLDLLVTGLAIGGGTKPLHDLISNLQAAKDSKKDPS
jgi:hypothetical protein